MGIYWAGHNSEHLFPSATFTDQVTLAQGSETDGSLRTMGFNQVSLAGNIPPGVSGTKAREIDMSGVDEVLNPTWSPDGQKIVYSSRRGGRTNVYSMDINGQNKRQLTDSQYRFYAINGGNDLGGMFLTAAEVGEFKNSLGKKSDWPYLPTQKHPWYGQEH